MILDIYNSEQLFQFKDEKELITACLSGNEQGWNALIQRYGRLIYTIPLRFGFPEQAADEVFQETCIVIYEKLCELRDHTRLGTWIVTITKRRCIQRQRDMARSAQLSTDTEGIVQHSTLDEELILNEQHELVHRAIQKLDPRCQELLRHLFFDNPELSYNDLANILSIPRGSIGPLRGRCLEKLQFEFQLLEANACKLW